jgi:hypothetical protein
MSYSFSAKGATKTALQAAVVAELEKVAAAQPAHSVDVSEAAEAVEDYADLLQDDETRDYSASVSGSVYTTDAGCQQASIQINVALVNRE